MTENNTQNNTTPNCHSITLDKISLSYHVNKVTNRIICVKSTQHVYLPAKL